MSDNSSCTLVTGGTGFIGRRLVQRLLANHGKIRVLGRRPMVRWRSEPRIEHIRADISEPGLIEPLLEGVGTVYHLAAATEGNADDYERVTVGATKELLYSLDRKGGGRVIFVSSLSVYDSSSMHGDCVIDEGFPLEKRPTERGLYARSKSEAEEVARSYLGHPSVKLTIVRPGLVYGPGAKSVLNGAALSVKGRLLVTVGKKRRLPLIFVDDLAEMLVRLAASPATAGAIYNAAGPDRPTVAEFLELYREQSGDRRLGVNVPLQSLVPVLRVVDRLSLLTGRRLSLAAIAARLAADVALSADRIRREVNMDSMVGWRDGLRATYPR